MKVNFVDLKAQYKSIGSEIDEAIRKVISETSFIKGKYVSGFEEEFARELGVKHCIAVANGTDAIYILLKMLGIGEGDEVITVANSWISSSESISETGARPVFVDIERDYYTIDVSKIEEKITERTKAIFPVHLYGQAAEMAEIQSLCKKHDLYLLEDCAQAHFTKLGDRNVGTFGDGAIYSFYPGKNLGAYGDAGAIVTNDDELARKCRLYSNHGALTKHKHEIEGINSRMDGLQGAVLGVKLKYIHEWNANRLDNGRYYNELLAGVAEVESPVIRDDSRHTFHVYCIRAERRDELKSYLEESGISTAIHYPCPLPLLDIYRKNGRDEEDYPVAREYMSKILSLPMYPELGRDEIEYVVSKIKEFYTK